MNILVRVYSCPPIPVNIWTCIQLPGCLAGASFSRGSVGSVAPFHCVTGTLPRPRLALHLAIRPNLSPFKLTSTKINFYTSITTKT